MLSSRAHSLTLLQYNQVVIVSSSPYLLHIFNTRIITVSPITNCYPARHLIPSSRLGRLRVAVVHFEILRRMITVLSVLEVFSQRLNFSFSTKF
jgi:hypothetical protein